MALKQQHHLEVIMDRENLIGKTGKAQLPIKGSQVKRTALGEVGNKLHNQNQNNAAIKKPTASVMGPPQILSRKPITKSQSSKATVKKATEVERIEKTTTCDVKKSIIKREDSILKPVVARVENTIVNEDNSYSSKQLGITDPDASSKNEPQMVTEYIGDIFAYLRQLETDFPIQEKYLNGHQSSPRMRAILVNWLVEVHMNFKFCLETLHLCIAIVDRYLQTNKSVGRSTLQLVGTSAMLIASKYEEMYLPELDDFVYICDDTFSKKQILQMEVEILKKLEFNLGRPLSLHFLRRYSKIAQAKADHHTLGKYILELALQDYEVCHVKPSIQAAAACCLSIGILNEVADPSKVWTRTLVHYTTYQYSDFKSVLMGFAHLIALAENSKYQAIRKKYASASFAKISLNSKLDGPLIRKLTLDSPANKK